jgi:hypothetical protein
MKTFRLISWILWGLSIILAIIFALMKQKDLVVVANISMWIFLVCGDVGNHLVFKKNFKEIKERLRNG